MVASTRSANRSARIADRVARTAERSLLAGQRPLLVNSRLADPKQNVQFSEGKLLTVCGGEATLEVSGDAIYMALAARNVGTGLAVLHGWYVQDGLPTSRSHPPVEEFTSQIRDIYLPPGDIGFWQGALRDPADEVFKTVATAIETTEPLTVNILYGDFEGDSGSSASSRCRTKSRDGWCRRAGTSSSTGQNLGSTELVAKRPTSGAPAPSWSAGKGQFRFRPDLRGRALLSNSTGHGIDILSWRRQNSQARAGNRANATSSSHRAVTT